MRESKKCSSLRNTARKNLRRNKAHLDALIAEAIVDAYNESEQTVGFYTMMENSLALPFVTEILGIKVAVEQIDMNEDNAIVAVCRHDSKRQRIPILDLPLPSPTPRGAEWIAAYRYWRMGRT
jgi:Calcium binding